MTCLKELLKVADDAARVGSALLHSAAPGQITAKEDRDFVTDLDLKIQESVFQRLSESTPLFDFLGEEQQSGQNTDDTEATYQWILDPIDGTSNFIHGIRLCAVSLALTFEDVPVVAVIHAPFLGLEYHAYTDGGAFCNGARIKTSGTKDLRNSIISIGDYAVGRDAAAKNLRRLAVTAALAEHVERIRMFGSAALDLAWVAEGRIDGCVLLSNKPWDTAAGVLIARESGAVVTDSDGSDHALGSAHTIAANPTIAPDLLDLIAATA
ncbi:inositol monophosphatase family protein [Nocardia sp. CS682]|uniref:inositol monophosphatase family protein n=1 Tax=Nocardia sp. CS682 TaxID=1047172 RepID=UPI001074B2A3|nr:inositol monophosphatase family protein [Nocardia sp. CS682]QBS45726.1 inositol monophosphatase [Nocardia sp. CS682]